MYERAKNYTLERPRLKKTVAVLIVLFGVLGMIIPGVPGIVFLIIGLELLGLRFLFLDRLLHRVPQTSPVPVVTTLD